MTNNTATVAPTAHSLIGHLFIYAIYLNARATEPIKIIADEDRHSAFVRAGNWMRRWNYMTKTGTAVKRIGHADVFVDSSKRGSKEPSRKEPVIR